MRGKGSLDLDSLHFPFQFSTLRDIAESNFQVSYDKGKESSIVAFPHPFSMGFLETVVLVPLPSLPTIHGTLFPRNPLSQIILGPLMEKEK